MDLKDQAPAIGPYPEPVQLIHILKSYLFRIDFNVVLPSTPVPQSGLVASALFAEHFASPRKPEHARPAHL
jgi:hypothetical protein